MILREKHLPSGRQIVTICVVTLLFILAIALRVSLYSNITSDYTAFVSRWYDYIESNGGFAAFKDDFYNYNPPYLYLLAIATYIPVAKLVAIKTIAVIFDCVLGLFTYLIIRLKYKRSLAAIIGALVVLFAPTIFINSSAWGQCDAIYTAFCLGSLYFLLTDRPGWACAFFGIAFAFKLQAIFFLPVLLILLCKKRLPIGYLVLIPAIFVLSLVPAYSAGRSASSLLGIYAQQISSGGSGGGQFGGYRGSTTAGQFRGSTGTAPARSGQPASGQGGQGSTGNQFGGGVQGGQGGFGSGNASFGSGLTYNAPTIYQWLPTSPASLWKWVGIILAGLFVLGVAALVLVSKQRLTTDIILKLALVFVLGIPFFLPEMHERYFYLADVFSIAFAFYFPYLFFVPLVVQLCSLGSYAPYMLHNPVVSLALIAGAILVMVIVTLTNLVLTLYPTLLARIIPSETEEEEPVIAASSTAQQQTKHATS